MSINWQPVAVLLIVNFHERKPKYNESSWEMFGVVNQSRIDLLALEDAAGRGAVQLVFGIM